MKLLKRLIKKEPSATPEPKQRRIHDSMVRAFSLTSSIEGETSFSTSVVPISQIINRTQRKLVAQSRDAYMRNNNMHKFVRLCKNNVIGEKGVQLQMNIKNEKLERDELAIEAIETHFAEWCRKQNCDISQRKSLSQIQKLAIGCAATDGEYLIRLLNGHGKYGLQLQILDPQLIPVNYHGDLKGGSYIRHGIEFNEYNAIVAYYFKKSCQNYENDYTRIPANEIIFDFLPEFPMQKRGFPWGYTALSDLEKLHDLDNTVLDKMDNAASMTGFAKIAGKSSYGDADIIELERDAITLLGHDDDLQLFNIQYPSGEAKQFNKTKLQGIGSGMGVPYHSLTGDLEGANYSSLRSGELDSRELWKELQEWFINGFMHTVFEAWLKNALLKGIIKDASGKVLSPVKFDYYNKPLFQGRRWSWVDPSKDIKAAEVALKNNLISHSTLMRERGYDPETIFKEIASDKKKMQELGITNEDVLNYNPEPQEEDE